MTDSLFDLRDAVVTALNTAPGGTFTPSFTAVAADAPINSLEQLKSLQVNVVASSDEEDFSSRVTVQSDMQIDVGIQQVVPGQNDPLFATLRGLVKSIRRYMLRRRLVITDGSYVCVSTVNGPPYYPDHLKSHSVFTSVVSLRFKAQVLG